MAESSSDKGPIYSIRAGVFRDVASAENAVHRLMQAGFSRDQISVLCSEKSKERHFKKFEHEDPAGEHTAEAVAKGSTIGAILGALVTAGVTTAAGVSILAAGPSFLIGGAVAGGFVAAMQTRGAEGTLADYYDQALTRGDLLVAVEDDDPGSEKHLQQAEQIFREAGAEPIPLEAE